MSSDLTPEVVELIEKAAKHVIYLTEHYHVQMAHAGLRNDECWACRDYLKVAAELRALLPVADQPECPNCHHKDREHGDRGCGHSADEPENWCDCPIGAHALNNVRALVAATVEHMRAGKPAERKPRVWHEGDEEPKGVRAVVDRNGCWWYRTGGSWAYATWNLAWETLAREESPLTEVLDGGDQS